MRISDWSSDVCSSDLTSKLRGCTGTSNVSATVSAARSEPVSRPPTSMIISSYLAASWRTWLRSAAPVSATAVRSEEHTSELQSLMRISYSVSCLKKKTINLYVTTYMLHTFKTYDRL